MRKQVSHENSHELELYRFAHQMMVTVFKNDDIKVGVRNALFLIKMFTQSDDVLLYQKDKTGEYNLYLNALMIKNNRKNNVDWLKVFINKSEHLLEDKSAKNVDCKDISDDENITLMPFTSFSHKYVLVIRNCNIYEIHKNNDLVNMLFDDMSIMLKQLDKHNQDKKASNKDVLTGLDNRNAYEVAIKELSKTNEKFTYVLFDLFRLKYVNDNYDYMLGDEYIKKTADILKKYFSKWFMYKDTAGIITKIPTGSCVYRLGGDEFILISKYESVDNIKTKLKLIEEEVSNIELNVSEKLCLGINYGIAEKTGNETIKELAITADDEMKEHKYAMYEKYGVEQRKQLIKK